MVASKVHGTIGVVCTQDEVPKPPQDEQTAFNQLQMARKFIQEHANRTQQQQQQRVSQDDTFQGLRPWVVHNFICFYCCTWASLNALQVYCSVKQRDF